MTSEHIVANGRNRLLKDPTGKTRIEQAIAGVRTRYEWEMQQVGIFGRCVLWFRMKKEMRQIIETMAPSKGCYISR